MKKGILDHDLELSKVMVPEGQEEAEGFIALPLRSIKGEGPLPFDLYLKIRTKNSTSPQFVTVCQAGDTFRGTWMQKLEQAQIFRVYAMRQAEKEMLHYLFGNLEKAMSDPETPEKQRAALTYDAALVWLRHSYENLQQRVDVEVQLVIPLLSRLIHLIKQENYWRFLSEIMQRERGTHSHSMNVCFIGLGFIGHLGWESRTAQAFGLGTLLHDLGMTKVPKEIVQKPGRLTEEEMGKVKLHPQQGYHKLKNFAWMYRNALLMVLQHHENCNGSGYPQGLKLNAIHPWSRILRIVDSYEAMTSPRPWREAMSPAKALWTIREGAGSKGIFDPSFFQAFVKFLAKYKI